MRVTYVDEQIRIIRPANNIPSEENVVFVYRRIINSWIDIKIYIYIHIHRWMNECLNGWMNIWMCG